MHPRNWPIALFDGLLWLQGIYYALTGIWPLVSIDTFQKVTGKKTDHLVTGHEADHWLVMTVGVLVTAIALGLLLAGAWRNQRHLELALLAFAAALGLTAIDLIYVYRQAIAPIYLVDAGIEAIFIAGWILIFATGCRII